MLDVQQEGVPQLARQRLTAVWAALAVGLASLLSLVVGLAVNSVPKSWVWAHNWWLLSGIGTFLVIAAISVAALQARSSPDRPDEDHLKVRVTHANRSSIAGSNAGTMISAETVFIGSTGTADANENASLAPEQLPDPSRAIPVEATSALGRGATGNRQNRSTPPAIKPKHEKAWCCAPQRPLEMEIP